MTDPHTDYRALREEIESHPGTLAYNAWDGLRRVHMILIANQAELAAFLERGEHDFDFALELMQNVRPSNLKDRFLDEVVRLMHNYTASARTLVDHSRNLVGTYRAGSNGPFVNGYDQRIEDIKARPVVAFVGDLRNYVLHYKVPPMELDIHFPGTDGSNQVDTTIAVQVRPLLEWDSLTAKARPYVNGKEAIALKDLVREYAEVIEDLYRWMFAQFEDLHGAELREVDALRRRWDDGSAHRH